MFFVPREGLEPSPLAGRDFESRADTNFATSADTKSVLKIAGTRNFVSSYCVIQCWRIKERKMADSRFYGDSIFWVEVDKVKPNPYQPRHEFDEARLNDLADSIRQYGILQPLVVTRNEVAREDGGFSVTYELIAGERRLRASKIAGLSQVPVIIRSGEEQNRMKLELAIIENLQREDLNPIDRARAFARLVEEFGFKHVQIGQKMGKSREYVSNSLRLLSLPQEIQSALSTGKISEGHARPIMMLVDHPEEQATLFKEIIYKKLTVREAEGIARRIALDRVRKKEFGVTPEMMDIEKQLTEALGTRVQIEQRAAGGKIMIDYFSTEDLRSLLELLKSGPKEGKAVNLLNRFLTQLPQEGAPVDGAVPPTEAVLLDDRSSEEKEDEDMYSMKNFSI